MAFALGSVLVWLVIAAVISAAAIALKVLFGIVGMGLRLIWVLVALPVIILAAVLTGPLLLVGVVMLVVYLVSLMFRCCRH
ncbi:MAG: hypothetical protein HPY55_02035 [Firmicutes bacterium]|nr:hypothetical protein [Bacillota bacterium]